MELSSKEDLDRSEDEQEMESNDEIDSGQEASVAESDADVSASDDQETESTTGNDNIIYGNFGWADAMSKVLNSSKPKKKKSVILAKAKKDADKPENAVEAPISFEIDNEVKQVVTLSKEELLKQKKEMHTEKLLKRQRRKEWDLVGRVIPSITQDRERERILARIGTRGVVQLFNSVKIQQKTIQDKLREAGPLERKREKALKSLNKSDFLELLQGNSTVKVKKEEKAVKEESTWNVLRDDFMPQVTMRDWNKQASSDSELE